MKRSLSVLLFFIVMMLIPQVVYAEKPIHIYINGQKIHTDLQPLLVNNTLYVPPSVMTDGLKVSISFTNGGNTATIADADTTIEMKKGQTTAKVNGRDIPLSTPFIHLDGRAYFPMGWISSQVGAMVTWDGLTKSAIVFKKAITILSSSEEEESTYPSLDGNQLNDSSAASNGETEGTSGANGEAPVNQKPIPVIDGLPQIERVEFIDSQLIIQTTEPVTPAIFTLSKPNRLVIDLPNSSFGATFNDEIPVQNGILSVSHLLTDQIRYSLMTTEPANPRFVVDLKQPINFEVALNGNQIVISMEPKRAALVNGENRIVMIDPGHGGKDPGASGVSGNYEKDFNLAVSMKVYEILSQSPGIDVHMTRYDDSYPTLEERAVMANERNADVFVSIHANTNESHHIHGTETYYSRTESVELANILHDHILAAGGLLDRKVKKADFKVIKETKMPAVLLEIGFISNPEEEAILLQPSFQDQIANAIALGIKQYLQVE